MSQEKGAVDGLKAKLYSRTAEDTPKDVRAPLSHEESETPVAWEPPRPPEPRPTLSQQEKKGMPFSIKFFIGSIVFFVLALGAAAYMFFGGNNLISPRNIEIEVIAPSLIDGGKAATLQVIIKNRNTSPLLLADLVVDYPDGTRDATDPTKDLSYERQSLGTIGSGEQIKKTASAVFFGQEGSEQTVRVTLEYTVANSNAIFTKDADVSFVVGSSPVSISVAGPSDTIAGEPFDLTLTVQSNAQAPVENVVIEGQYPFGYILSGALPSPTTGNKLWRLGTMLPGTTKTITLRGSLEGEDGDDRVFRFLAGSDPDETNTRIPVPFLSVPVALTVNRPFLGGTLAVEGQSGKSISATAGKLLQGTISLQNNLSEAISDVEVTLEFEGPALDKSSVSPGSGFYQSNNSRVIWTKSQDPLLASIAPGGTGQLTFSFASLLPGSGGVVYTNPVIALTVRTKGTRQGSEGQPQITSTSVTSVNFASAANLSVVTTRSGGLHPPRAESSSTYVLQWSVKNSSNALANASVSTVLPPYASFVAGQAGAGITYDSASRTVRWSIGDIKAGVGYSEAPLSTSFQVAIVPSETQVGSAPTLTGTALFQATDRFAQVQVSSSAAAPATLDSVVPKQ